MTSDEIYPTKRKVLSRIRRHNFTLTKRMEEAFLKVPREEFVHPSQREMAYRDTPLPIPGNQTISAIHMVLFYLSPDCTDPKVGDTVLEIGLGSGYNAAMYAEMVAPEGAENPGHVYGVEIVPELIEFAKNNLQKAGYRDRVTVIQSDGGWGYKEEAPYDVISFACSAKKVPDPILPQLKKGGRLVIPIKKAFFQDLVLLRKDEEGNTHSERKMGVAFVPLTGEFE